ncbi:hypothetical protein ACF3DV_00080 [Chlorogloeopsis fritschii PCC 9212]|uniref:hypothetical protein n=1 Tax=Chlorogloeopsis fritschii TaxID=1124 RepID=UPI0012F6B949|nr:hypothetical protein [Chlorogloeopsis fritschii]
MPTCRREATSEGSDWRQLASTGVRVLLMSFGLKLIIYLLNPPVQWLVVSGLSK